jgi:hypothetical protein
MVVNHAIVSIDLDRNVSASLYNTKLTNPANRFDHITGSHAEHVTRWGDDPELCRRQLFHEHLFVNQLPRLLASGNELKTGPLRHF